jgi:hypothetical protein
LKLKLHKIVNRFIQRLPDVCHVNCVTQEKKISIWIDIIEEFNQMSIGIILFYAQIFALVKNRNWFLEVRIASTSNWIEKKNLCKLIQRVPISECLARNIIFVIDPFLLRKRMQTLESVNNRRRAFKFKSTISQFCLRWTPSSVELCALKSLIQL